MWCLSNIQERCPAPLLFLIFFTFPIFSLHTGFFQKLVGLFLSCLCIPAILAKDIDNLAASNGWKKLLHHNSSVTTGAASVSKILSEEFFLSPNGSSDPAAELRATLVAMLEPVSAPDSHARCRFPARAAWLQKNGIELPSFNFLISCPAYQKWIREGQITSLSIVLASGYLGNPASFYGHTLLKFNRGGERSSALLDETLNYGAIVDKTDGPIAYVLKGVFGGYEAGFSHIDFYFHEHNYGNVELRNLWEYRLNLTKDEVDFVIAHAWEVLGKKYTYYFFRENCAYRMAELIEIVDGLEIIPPNRPYTVPQSLIMQINEVNRNGQPLVSKVIFHPSRQSRFYQRYQQLDQQEKRLLADLVTSEGVRQSAMFDSLPPESKARVLEILLDYYRMLNADAQKLDPLIEEKYADALRRRFQAGPGRVFEELEAPAPPHDSRHPSWLQIGYLHNSNWGAATTLRIRPAYYDLLDSGPAHVRNSTLSMGDVQLLLKNGQLYLYRLDLIKIESVNPGVSGLPGDRGLAWNIRFGGEQATQSCFDCFSLKAQADVGIGRTLAQKFFVGLYVGAIVQQSIREQPIFQSRISSTFVAHLSQDFTFSANLEKRTAFHGRYESPILGRAEMRKSVGRNEDIRIGVEFGNATSAFVGVGLYW